jgi:hypothetical protein
MTETRKRKANPAYRAEKYREKLDQEKQDREMKKRIKKVVIESYDEHELEE